MLTAAHNGLEPPSPGIGDGLEPPSPGIGDKMAPLHKLASLRTRS